MSPIFPRVASKMYERFTGDDKGSAESRFPQFEVAYKIGEEGDPVGGLPSVKPVTIEFSLQAKREENAYQEFLTFMKATTEGDIAVTLDKVDLSGTGRGAQKLEMSLTAYMNQGT